MEKTELEKLLSQNLDATQIAKEKNCSRNRVIYWLAKHNLKTNKQKQRDSTYSSKYCRKCNTVKPNSEFYSLKDNSLATYCTECHTKHYANKRLLFRKTIINKLGGKCSRCGYNKCLSALDVHHLNPQNKTIKFSNSGLTLNDKVLKELEECILLCANCHREEHSPKYL